MKITKIGIMGLAQSGKSTLAKQMQENISKRLNEVCYVVSFAEYLKQVVLNRLLGDLIERPAVSKDDVFFNVDIGEIASFIADVKIKSDIRTKLTYREILQLVGSLANQYKPNVFVNKWLERVDQIIARHKDGDYDSLTILCDDVRFLLNERLLFDKTIYVYNPNQQINLAVYNHASEHDARKLWDLAAQNKLPKHIELYTNIH